MSHSFDTLREEKSEKEREREVVCVSGGGVAKRPPMRRKYEKR